MNTVMILSFRTDRSEQTVQTQIRVYTVCHSICIIWAPYSMVEPPSSNFRVITTNVLGVRIFRKFTVPTTCFYGSCRKLSLNYHQIPSLSVLLIISYRIICEKACYQVEMNNIIIAKK